ncbi:MAG: phage replisome organizer N-terminal domain-containing protein [Eubacteriales bacterium]
MQDKIAILESQKNGFLFTNIFLKLYLLSMKNNGKLMLSDDIFYTTEMLAGITGHKLAIVEQALEQCKQLELIKESVDMSLFVPDYQLLVSSILSESQRKQAYRTKEKVGQEQDKKTELSQEKDEVVTGLSQEKDSDVTENKDKVPEQGQIPDDIVTENQAPTNQRIKPNRLKKPKKMEGINHIENEKENTATTDTPEQPKNSP